jgi:hypothetical protein
MTMMSLAALVGTGVARADWLDDAWGEDSVQMNGNPAVSISGDTVHVVLPVTSLRQAYEEGLTIERALRDFLDRHGQRCSHLIDLNNPHPNLKVALSVQVRTPFESISEGEDVLALVKSAYLKYHTDDSIPMLFTVSPVEFEYSLNYVPTHRVRCVAPKGDDATS